MASQVSLTWTSPQAWGKSLEQYGKDELRKAAGALYREGERIMTKSNMLVPVDTGVLRNSGHVEQPQVQGQTISVLLGYGGAANTYALVVHEDMTARHTTGQAKYLDQPFNEALSGMSGRIAADMR